MKLKDLMPWRSGSDIDLHRNEDPFSRLHREMNQMMEQFWNTDMDEFFRSDSALTEKFQNPRLDVSVDEDTVQVKAELPGVEEKDIELTIKGGHLTISGEKKEEAEDKKDGYYRRERSYGQFRRTVRLGNEVDEAGAKATFKNGVLHVTIPRTESDRSQTKRIPISAS